MGNNMKSLKLSLEGSLRKLRTNYIDIFYVHFWDLHSSVEEIMDGLHNFVVTGKVLYLVSRMLYSKNLLLNSAPRGSQTAHHGSWSRRTNMQRLMERRRKPQFLRRWTTVLTHYARFVVFQAAYSVTQRDIEREILPMCRHEGELSRIT